MSKKKDFKWMDKVLENSKLTEEDAERIGHNIKHEIGKRFSKMTLNIKVIPNSKENKIIEETDRLKIYLKERAQDGKANKALIDLLAKHFSCKKSQIKIVKGEKSREKIVEIL